MELEIWSGDWGLPSIDCECLQILTLLRISGAEFEVSKTNNPFFTTEGLPVLKLEKQKFHSFHHILSYLQRKNYAPDPNLNAKELSESLAYRNMVEQKLYPALRYIWWVDGKNYSTVTGPRYAKMLPFPLNHFYPGHYRRTNITVIHSLYQHLKEDNNTIQVETLLRISGAEFEVSKTNNPFFTTEGLPVLKLEKQKFHSFHHILSYLQLKLQIFSDAEKCLTCLSNRLGDRDFFFGSHPSALDAFVFGCLAPLLKAPFPTNALQNHLKACPNLVKLVTRISQRYFSRELREYEKEKPRQDKTMSKSEVFPNKTRDQILAAAVAITAMLIYGIYNGIFSISLNNSDSDDGEVNDLIYEE